MTGYQFDVENGEYEVTLMFAEIYFTQSGKRIFHVEIEGTRVLTNYNIFVKVGHDYATNQTFLSYVNDGQLNINFIHFVESPKISAIQIKTSNQSGLFRTTNENINIESPLPEFFILNQNYPNPFNPITTIRYQIPEENRVLIKIYNVLGQEVCKLVDAIQQPGFYSICWNGMDYNSNSAPNGLYICSIIYGRQVKNIKMTKIN